MRVVVRLELTPWRESTPPGMWLRDWFATGESPIELLPTFTPCGDPDVPRGGAAVVREEGPHAAPPNEPRRRWSWRIWTPIGNVWPYRGGLECSQVAAVKAANEALAELVGLLTTPQALAR